MLPSTRSSNFPLQDILQVSLILCKSAEKSTAGFLLRCGNSETCQFFFSYRFHFYARLNLPEANLTRTICFQRYLFRLLALNFFLDVLTIFRTMDSRRANCLCSKFKIGSKRILTLYQNVFSRLNHSKQC